MDLLTQYLDFTQGLDFWTKYGLIIANFVTITLIILVKKYRKKSGETKQEEKKHILFVTAHPDDQAMFFLPTIENLRELYHMHLLCFSNGNFDGLGKIRQQELEKCCQYLQFKKLEIINHEGMKDGPNSVWKSEVMIEILKKYIEKEKIKGVITFDEQGVSGHSNHIAVYDAVQCLQVANQSVEDEKERISFFTLISVNFFRKYSGMLDFFISAFSQYTYVNSDIFQAWNSMKIHNSQFVWYRKLFVIFSRYAYINTLRKL